MKNDENQDMRTVCAKKVEDLKKQGLQPHEILAELECWLIKIRVIDWMKDLQDEKKEGVQ